MANLTITVDEETVKRARIRALEEGTSVNALLRDYLEEYSGVRRERSEALERILAASEEETSAGTTSGGRGWTRDDIHEERLGRYGRGG